MTKLLQKKYFLTSFLENRIVKICFLSFFILAIIASFSWKVNSKNRLEKSLEYFEVLNKNLNVDIVDLDKVKYIMNILHKKYSDTNYAYFGSLLTSRALYDNGDLQGACDELKWVYNNSNSVLIRSIASLRISSLLLDQCKYKESIAYLDKPIDSFFTLFADKKGDIFFAQDNIKEANYWWSKAMESIEENDPLLPIIQSKIDSLSFY
ncbi:hypothetical protein CONE_0625 [Candidatus Kinetoplastibacterium oncopeltii TCC290E]|uniref:Ancillary SecYEG translocon subunit/Cell division coordinator CpoB TPR domain-containing protein n=1 Tax=Candidatus Kinetoplastidibacterium stringomonadis TCC290E TaxID=1208920 RepID=M1LS59_9PROT|nr:tetratricopeptide repeat protein [Candidatus Kinetoplastibacterium oncopeltii]AGF48382.1 hypothetical protein CONE_0625 [Candidatus Kinetoplastibacterium oncopeltii TCC290E]